MRAECVSTATGTDEWRNIRAAESRTAGTVDLITAEIYESGLAARVILLRILMNLNGEMHLTEYTLQYIIEIYRIYSRNQTKFESFEPSSRSSSTDLAASTALRSTFQ